MSRKEHLKFISNTPFTSPFYAVSSVLCFFLGCLFFHLSSSRICDERPRPKPINLTLAGYLFLGIGIILTLFLTVQLVDSTRNLIIKKQKLTIKRILVNAILV